MEIAVFPVLAFDAFVFLLLFFLLLLLSIISLLKTYIGPGLLPLPDTLAAGVLFAISWDVQCVVPSIK